MTLFGGMYAGRRVLLTGHTGFKGSWLALWLSELGADVQGVALPAVTEPNHWDLLDLKIVDHRADIRDADALASIVRDFAPEAVFHLAAQPLVLRSYVDPLETWSTNVMGTVNVLEACRATSSVRAIVIVTSDKCYENHEWPWGYREIDGLGGHDPYSASKAAAEIVAASYRRAYFGAPSRGLVATARAGNVVGGGDWSDDRLIPDLVRALASGNALEIRSPRSTRPWQHVLESLSGYLRLGEFLLQGDARYAESWNFGPSPDGAETVESVLTRMQKHWPELAWRVTTAPQPSEARLLTLDISKARQMLGWRPTWTLMECLEATASWYRGFLAGEPLESRTQLLRFVEAARQAGAQWAGA